jgi:hypothetical protein
VLGGWNMGASPFGFEVEDDSEEATVDALFAHD